MLPLESVVMVGSRALALRAPHLLLRKPLDFDFVCSPQAFEAWTERNLSKVNPETVAPSPTGKKMVVMGGVNCEFELARPGNTAHTLVELVRDDRDTLATPMGLVPCVDILFTIKASHRFLKNSPHFWKTLADYHAMRLAGARVRPEHRQFLAAREKETYAYSHPSLNQGKAGFFSGDAITYVYDHDSVHRAIMLGDVPAYALFQRDGAEVAVDRSKFERLPRAMQLASVVEEATVLAIERSLVPFPGVMTEEIAWRFALSKVLSSVTSGWWREFAYENALDVLKMYPTGYWERFQRGVDDGTVVRL